MAHGSVQNVVILAARSTIGQAVADRVLKSGGRVALIGRDLSGITTDAASFATVCDLTDFDAVSDAIVEASEAL